MGFQLKQGDMEQVFDRLTGGYDIYGPVRMTGEGMYSDTDVVQGYRLSFGARTLMRETGI